MWKRLADLWHETWRETEGDWLLKCVAAVAWLIIFPTLWLPVIAIWLVTRPVVGLLSIVSLVALIRRVYKRGDR